MKFKRRLGEDDEAVPMSSMADIAFLLIIFFMVTAVFDKSKGIVLELPETSVRETVETKEIEIMIDKEGKIFLGSSEIKLEELAGAIVRARKADSSKPVVVKSDKRVSYGKVADVMDELLKAGVRDIALPTAAEEEGG